MNKKIIQTIPSIILYFFAGLILTYAIWSYTYCADIIKQAKAAGQLASSGNEYDIVSFYMSNSGQYIVFALLLAAMGFLLHKKPLSQNNSEIIEQSSKNKADDELDEWFNEMDNINQKPKEE